MGKKFAPHICGGYGKNKAEICFAALQTAAAVCTLGAAILVGLWAIRMFGYFGNTSGTEYESELFVLLYVFATVLSLLYSRVLGIVSVFFAVYLAISALAFVRGTGKPSAARRYSSAFSLTAALCGIGGLGMLCLPVVHAWTVIVFGLCCGINAACAAASRLVPERIELSRRKRPLRSLKKVSSF